MKEKEELKKWCQSKESMKQSLSGDPVTEEPQGKQRRQRVDGPTASPSSSQLKSVVPDNELLPIEIDELGSFQFGIFTKKGFNALKNRCRIVCESGPVELDVWYILPEAVQVLYENGFATIRRPTLSPIADDGTSEQKTVCLYEAVDAPTLPNDVGYRQRLCTFRDLWRKGFYVTPGTKFGCDYLAYEGVPGEVHSSYLVSCIGAQDSLQPLDLIAASRLASQVKKIVLFAVVASDSLFPYYITANWWKGDK